MLDVQTAARNIARTYRKANQKHRRHGFTWYAEAHRFCRTLAEAENMPLDKVVGCLAALSPQCPWSDNLRACLSLVKTRNLPPNVAVLPMNHAKAFSILYDDGVQPLDVLGGSKVIAFYHNILNPFRSRHVTVDTHAARVAFGCADLTPKQVSFVFRKTGNKIIQEAYCIVARRYGILPHRVQAVTWLKMKDQLTQLPEDRQQQLYIK